MIPGARNCGKLPILPKCPHGFGWHLGRWKYDVKDTSGRYLAPPGINPLQQRTTSIFDAAARTIATLDGQGKRTTFGYDNADRQTSVLDPALDLSQKRYDAAGRTISTIDPISRRTTYLFDAVNRQIAVIDPAKARNTTIFDVGGRKIAEINAISKRTSYAFDVADRQIAVRNPLNAITTTTFDAAGRAIAQIDQNDNSTAYKFDGAGQRIAATDPTGAITTTTFNPAGWTLSDVNALGKSMFYKYDSNGRKVGQTDAMSGIYTTVYDPAGRITSEVDPLNNATLYKFDAADQQIAVKDPALGITTSAYDAAGRTTGETNPLGFTTLFRYDLADRQIAVKDPLNGFTTTIYDAAGQSKASIDPLSQRTTFHYDMAGRRTSSTNPRGYITTTIYDLEGRTLATVDALLNRTSFIYDAANRKVAVENALGNRTTTIYDPTGLTRAVENALGFRTSFAYDKANRKIAERNPLNLIVTTIYDLVGNTRATVDGLGHRTTNLFDAINRKIATIDANLHRTTMLYDLASNLKATVDANNHRTTNIYDVNKRRIALVDPRSNRTSFNYDLAGNEVGVQDALGNRTTSVFDALNRKVKRTDARNNRTTFAYDAASRQTQRLYPDGARVTQVYDVIGNRTLLSDATGRYTAMFDPLDRLSARTNPANKCITYVYDGISQRRRLVDPDGGIVTTVYDPISEITKVVNAQVLTTTFAYDTAGRRTVKISANTARTSFSYDNSSRLTRMVNIKSSGVTISSFGYQYDKTTRRTGVTEATGDRVTWTYDPTYQLTHEQRSGVNSYNVTYTYDPAGNRTLKNDSGALTTSTYDKANRLTYAQDGTGRTTFTFDATGNQTKQLSPALDITTSVWDFENLNTAVLLPDTTRVTLVYSGDKMRVEKNATSGTARFIFDGQNILLETDGSNLTQAVYTLEPKEFGNLISQRQLQFGSWVPIYYAFDGLGSTDSLTDASQVITDTYTYFAFGVIKASTGTTTNRFAWVGQLLYVRDSETGEYEMHVRQILPDRGRAKSPDPKRIEGRANPYDYATNDPVNRVDPSGLDPEGYVLMKDEDGEFIKVDFDEWLKKIGAKAVQDRILPATQVELDAIKERTINHPIGPRLLNILSESGFVDLAIAMERNGGTLREYVDKLNANGFRIELGRLDGNLELSELSEEQRDALYAATVFAAQFGEGVLHVEDFFVAGIEQLLLTAKDVGLGWNPDRALKSALGQWSEKNFQNGLGGYYSALPGGALVLSKEVAKGASGYNYVQGYKHWQETGDSSRFVSGGMDMLTAAQGLRGIPGNPLGVRIPSGRNLVEFGKGFHETIQQGARTPTLGTAGGGLQQTYDGLRSGFRRARDDAAGGGALKIPAENRGLTWTTEKTGKGKVARDFEDSLPGATSDIPTQRRNVPALRYDNLKPGGDNLVRFDGVDSANTKVLIDRKSGVTTKSDQVRKFREGPLEALAQNRDYRLRIEVPNRKAQVDAERLVRYATGSNEPHPQIDIVIVSPQ